MASFSSCLFWFSWHFWAYLLCCVLQVSLFSWSSLVFCSFVSSVGWIGCHSSRILFTRLVPGSLDYSIIHVIVCLISEGLCSAPMVFLGSSCTPGSPGDLCSAGSVSYRASCSSLASSLVLLLLSGSCVCLRSSWFSWPISCFFLIALLITSRVIYRWTGGLSLSPLLASFCLVLLASRFPFLFNFFILRRIIQIFINIKCIFKKKYKLD